ncbi:MAG: DUF6077 domain-containing protein [Eubacteriales bacterium]|nr:DUF6077 domain-containing protein [Eubacteriales bacterium]
MAAILLLPFLYWCFGRTLFLFIKRPVGAGMCLLTGVFVYHGLFQAEALPLIFLKSPLSVLTVLWMLTIAAVGVLWLFLERKNRKRGQNGLWGETKAAGTGAFFSKKTGAPRCISVSAAVLYLCMLLAVGVQMYYVVTSEYLGWDTLSYVATIGTSVATDTMYQYGGQTGWKRTVLDLRYALSSFYMHAAVWCQVLPVRALYYAKIVQGGVLVILTNLTVFEMGRFLFSGKRHQGRISARQTSACGAAMVIAAVFIHFFYQSAFTASEFLMKRALEAKAYCANFVLPFLFLLGLMMWRDSEKRENRVMLLAASIGSVAVSMSGLVTAPVLLTLMFIPVFWKTHTWRTARLYVLCMLPNVLYLAVYLLYSQGVLRIGM